MNNKQRNGLKMFLIYKTFKYANKMECYVVGNRTKEFQGRQDLTVKLNKKSLYCTKSESEFYFTPEYILRIDPSINFWCKLELKNNEKG